MDSPNAKITAPATGSTVASCPENAGRHKKHLRLYIISRIYERHYGLPPDWMTSKERNTALQIRSNKKSKNAIEKITKTTTIELRINSVRVGHDTLFISASTAIKKSANLGRLTSRYPIQSPTTQNAADDQWWSHRSRHQRGKIHARSFTESRRAHQSNILSRVGESCQAASPNAIAITRKVTRRVSRPWLLLYKPMWNSSRKNEFPASVFSFGIRSVRRPANQPAPLMEINSPAATRRGFSLSGPRTKH